MLQSTTKLTRIGVFYDGNFFLHVNNYYAFNHARQSRISIRGLHDFIRTMVAEHEGSEFQYCQIVDAHFFRGRIPAIEAQSRGNLLYYERVFDDILMWEGVDTHYLPVRSAGGRREEKGIDVWMALEAYELTTLKHFDVVVLITSDGDYVPLLRKLNTLGTRVMVLSWDFEFEDQEGRHIVTRTSQELLEEVTYPVAMHEIIENRTRKNEPLILNLFVATDGRKQKSQQEFSLDRQDRYRSEPADRVPEVESSDNIPQEGEVMALKTTYGFIKFSPNNLFFHEKDLIDTSFEDLREGDTVEFTLGYNKEGDHIAKNVRLILES
ncbi:MAG: NYN domain-containing protein [Candidatus Kapabacteria bacterium]|nr:NYN domain-containing protein [Candidatus Kapabacteria bacterium]